MTSTYMDTKSAKFVSPHQTCSNTKTQWGFSEGDQSTTEAPRPPGPDWCFRFSRSISALPVTDRWLVVVFLTDSEAEALRADLRPAGPVNRQWVGALPDYRWEDARIGALISTDRPYVGMPHEKENTSRNLSSLVGGSVLLRTFTHVDLKMSAEEHRQPSTSTSHTDKRTKVFVYILQLVIKTCYKNTFSRWTRDTSAKEALLFSGNIKDLASDCVC